jgi:hypothetical protein
MIENENYKLWIDNGLLFSVFKKPTDMTLEVAKSAIELRHSISNDQHQYWCMDLRNLKDTSDEAKKYIDENGEEFLYACAMIVNSHLKKFMINIFNRTKKRKIPVEIFSSEIKAVKWLREMEKQNIKE